MTMDEMNRIAEEYDVKVVRDTYNCQRNSGAYAFDIMLGEFDNPQWEEIAFCHELGHMVNSKNKKCKYHVCTIAKEGAAWETGFELAAKHGHVFDYYGEEFKWARKQLETYRKNDENWR